MGKRILERRHDYQKRFVAQVLAWKGDEQMFMQDLVTHLCMNPSLPVEAFELVCSAALRLQAVPKKRVIPDLRGVVVNAARWGFADDLFQSQAFKEGPLDQAIEVGDVSLVMLGVVVVNRLCRHVRSQCILVERQRWELVFHGVSFVVGEIPVHSQQPQVGQAGGRGCAYPPER